MSNKRRLWQIFGPVICAVILLLVIFLLPWERTFSKESIYQAANSQTTTVFKGSRMKQNAYDDGYVPFYGSSELSRMDPLHPSVLAEKYHRDYQPFLLGGPGSQSLAQFLGMQGTTKQMRNKKAVVIISPQWFTKKGQDPNAFTLYYSPLQACNFLLSIKSLNKANQYAAKRFLQMPEIKGEVKAAMKRIAHGQQISATQRFALEGQRRMLDNEDKFFSSFQLRDRKPKIEKQAKLLPGKYSLAKLDEVADEQAASHTNSNSFGINNSFYKLRLNKRNLRKLKGSQQHFNYTKSVEYSDFELMLHQFAKQHTNVLFVIPPINQKWASYTGLSQTMYQKSVSKIKYQLESQGFENIADLSNRGGEKYFMEDTIHLGWRGWVAVDEAVKPFMAKDNIRYNYNLHNYFYSKKWQKKPSVVSLNNSSPQTESQKENLKEN
ncbi:D-alanyl-lipoteichoic acid biosynthesis protein DltD [Lactobacillus sp. ESL0681]|uniref:D-alanyl-lipoteichoic acid biosynthesis protein DltD n=1 Tax=Lactobacillus sp. ESL0681 TaxID=2983211 RepID=UPI0023F6E8CC|nr:D-alanyl-lipoteichoic acid biosynthesis protein DltD [Lactobacillus sp. ESL0681]WEV39850.1 D-alanyl-lipoteichoic acid biosynthesis protein DltD [Lactobacillus sp. ESL0681]